MQPFLVNLYSHAPVIMGILNVTPDSFSDGGQFSRLDAALRHALQMQDEGAGVIDVGGESTRPGAQPVPLQEELDRVIPVIEKIRAHSDVAISVDTSKPQVMKEAIAAGAVMVNDVNALQAEGAEQICADAGVAVCLMHKQGTPQTMQQRPHYEDVVAEVKAFLLERAEACIATGVTKHNIVLDPGFGFGKTLQNNLSLLKEIQKFSALGFPVLLGVSRKSMFGALLDLEVAERMLPSVAAAVIAYQRGVRFFRVHDVKATHDALKLCQAVQA